MNPWTWGRGMTRPLRYEEVPSDVLDLVRFRDGPGCVACRDLGLTPPLSEELELDYRITLPLGGDNHWENLQVLCRSHSEGRGNRPLNTTDLPAWLRRLAREGDLPAHVEWCHESRHLWAPVDGSWLAYQIAVFLERHRP